MVRAARLSLVLVVVLTLQTTWMADWRPLGAPGDLLLLVVVAGGMAAGPGRGAVIGFIAGIAMDLVLLTPFGLSSLTYLAVGYVVGSVSEGVLRSAPWIPLLTGFVASAAGLVLYVLLGQLVGQQFRIPDLGRIVIVTACINTVLTFPALAVMRWVEAAAPRDHYAGAMR